MTPGGEKVHTCNDIKDAALKARCESAFDACADLSQEDGSRATCEYRATSCIDNYLRGAPDYRIEMSRNNPLIYSTPGSCLGASVRVTKNLGPLARFAEAAGADKPEPGAGTRAPAGRRKSETRAETLPPEYEVCEKTGSRGSPKNDLCRERVGICLSDGPYGIPIGSSKIPYADRPACLRGVARLSRADSEIKPDSPVPQDVPEPPNAPLPPRPPDSPPMGERASALDDILKKLIREIDASPNYVKRIDAITERMRRRGVDVKSMGPVHPASSLIGGGALAMVIALGNDLFVGSAGGLSDFLLELVIAHEHRHRVQNESVWNDLVTKAGLDPKRCSLHKAHSGEGVPQEFKDVYERYLDAITGPSSSRGSFKELDAYIYMYDYYTKYLASEISQTQYFIFNAYLSYRIQVYLKEIDQEHGLGNMTGSEREVYEKAKVLRNNLDVQMGFFRDQKWARDFGRDLQRYLDGVYEKYSGTLEYPDGENYSLQERLLVLRGAIDEVGEIELLANNAANSGGIQGQRFSAISEDADEKADDLDSLLNRQTLGYAFQLRDNAQHAVEYRNDYYHTLDGLARGQWYAEADFGGKGDIKEDFRLGGDSGVYYHLTDNVFLTTALSFYAGYQTGIKNPMIGLRFDPLQLHWDIPFTQRFGVSLFAGYSLGMHLGWNDSDAYDEARVGAEIFNF